MSPRSAEYFAEARSRVAAARRELAAQDSSAATSLAYYALLYAARAALSEADRHARTHSGTWNLFWQTFVHDGRFDRSLAGAARNLQELRELSDYEAKRPTIAEADRAVDVAERFVDAVGELIG